MCDGCPIEIWANPLFFPVLVSERSLEILEYEQRLRLYSTPDKLFRYFATVRLMQGENASVYMTPDDFLRSICPGFRQPDGKAVVVVYMLCIC